MKGPIQLVLLTGADCPLCDAMKEELSALKSLISFKVQSIDIASFPELQKEYWDRIPYLFVNGRPFAKGQLDVQALKLRLLAAKAGLKQGALPRLVQEALSWNTPGS